MHIYCRTCRLDCTYILEHTSRNKVTWIVIILSWSNHTWSTREDSLLFLSFLLCTFSLTRSHRISLTRWFEHSVNELFYIYLFVHFSCVTITYFLLRHEYPFILVYLIFRLTRTFNRLILQYVHYVCDTFHFSKTVARLDFH
jgi:hypothetical protein